MGIERIVARRGTPSVIWSDKAKFRGSREVTLELYSDVKRISPAQLMKKGLKKKLNSTAAPHHSGLWERLVRCCKRVFYALIGNRKLTPKVLEITFCLVEQSLNARSITSLGAVQMVLRC